MYSATALKKAVPDINQSGPDALSGTQPDPVNAAFRLALSTLAIVCAGQLAGILVGTGMDQYALRNLAEMNWTAQHQTMDSFFSRIMPVLFNLTAVLLLAAAAMAKGSARWLFGTAALLVIASIVITVRIEVPINRAVAQWRPGSAPADWMKFRERWLWNHLLRTIAGTVAFWLAAIGLARS